MSDDPDNEKADNPAVNLEPDIEHSDPALTLFVAAIMLFLLGCALLFLLT